MIYFDSFDKNAIGIILAALSNHPVEWLIFQCSQFLKFKLSTKTAFMNFQRGKQNDEPEINLVPMIDVLLVILIFLVVTTTYSKFAELEINLPQASAEEVDKNIEKPNSIDITVNAVGDYTINQVSVKSSSIESLRDALQSAAQNLLDPFIIINADAKTTHQSVITVMEAARLAGYNKITFTTETNNAK